MNTHALSIYTHSMKFLNENIRMIKSKPGDGKICGVNDFTNLNVYMN